MAASLHISALHVYPIKGTRGLNLQSAVLGKAGLLYDREWMLAKLETGRFMSQREVPKMALIETSLPSEVLAGNKPGPEAALTVKAPGMAALTVPLNINASTSSLKDVTVWGWSGAGADQGDEAAAWFSKYLGQPVRLIKYLGSDNSTKQDDPTVRLTSEPQFDPDRHEVRFADGYPCLLANQASLDDLNRRLAAQGAQPIPMNRFRPNIVVAADSAADAGGGSAEGGLLQPWAEDNWGRLRVAVQQGGGAVELGTVKPCDRCKVPTIDQAKGESTGEELLDTLREFRTGKALGWAAKDKSTTHSIFFGMNVVSPQSNIALTVGDRVEVVELVPRV